MTATNLRIGLWNLENTFNTALMQVSQYHKQRGDQVEFYSPLYQYDKIYVFSMFNFTKKPKHRANMIEGGTGYDPTIKLPLEIEACDLDYSIYPECKTSYLWFSRGCNLNHSYCCIPKKEGCLRVVKPKNLNPHGKTIDVMDDSPFASPKWFDMIEYLQKLNMPVHFNTLDVRNLDDLKCKALTTLRYYKQIHISWDNPKENLMPKIELLLKYFKPWRVASYVLIGHSSTPDEDLMRVTKIRELGMDAWIMPFNKRDPYQKAFERWCNRHVGCEWHEYKHGSWNPQLIHAQTIKP